MKVKFFATIRDLSGCKEIEIPHEQTLAKLIDSLALQFGENFKMNMYSKDGKTLSASIIIMINGRHVIHMNGLNTELKESDEVNIFPSYGRWINVFKNPNFPFRKLAFNIEISIMCSLIIIELLE